MTEKHFQPKEYTNDIVVSSVGYESPSNIALIKYWGKYGNQLPKNPSISFTLNTCKTNTHISFEKLDKAAKNTFDFKVYLDGKHKPGFEPKIEQFFGRIQEYLPFINEYRFKIATSNSFPHSSGIASSASGMSALALCLVQMEKHFQPLMTTDYLYQKASFLSRLGSGSACRSLTGPMMVWGKHEDIKDSTNLYGVEYSNPIHNIFKDYQDTILMIDKGEKQVSSTVGHNLMNNHPYAVGRFEQANMHMTELIPILEMGDLEGFIHLVEREALTLHAMMMMSSPYFILMKPNTLSVIDKIWNFRRETKTPVCFTLDAGANVHVLYPESAKEDVLDFIKNELVVYCQNGQYICDKVGSGARML
ncbi:MAG: diphosphomevalonate decarboxylase [Leeuwenhoekiella sp.]